MDRVDRKIGFLGAGKMATALAQGWIDAGLVENDQLIASDPYPAAREQFQQQTQSAVTDNNLEVIENSEVIILAIKPQVIHDLLVEIQEAIKPEHLLVSIAAGVSIDDIQRNLGERRRVIRVMPNTPCLVGAMAAGFSPASDANEDDVQLVNTLLNAVGVAFQLPESLLDAVTGLSGSGPAFVAVMIEALTDGGVRMGLPRDVAGALATQTVLGTAKMAMDHQLHPSTIKDMVTSPGGTTIAGLHALERAGVRAGLMDAVESATLRSMELGKG